MSLPCIPTNTWYCQTWIFCHLIVILVLISFITSEFEHLFIYLLVVWASSSINATIHVLAQFLTGLSFPYWLLGVLYAFFIVILKLRICKISSLNLWFMFSFLNDVLSWREVLHFNIDECINLLCYGCAFGVQFKKVSLQEIKDIVLNVL